MPMLIDVAQLAGIVIEGPLYGVFFCLFLTSGYDLYNRRRRGDTELNWPMIVTGVSLIVLATIRFTLDVTYIFVAFIKHDPREARLAFLEDVHVELFIAKHSTLLTALLIGDCFMAYRCWVVWGKKYWIPVIPVLSSVAGTTCGAFTLWAYTHLPDENIFTEVNILKICFILSLVSNALSTSLIAFRIWWINRQRADALHAAGSSSSSTTPIIRIVLESGIMNAAFLFAFVMMLVTNSPSLELVSEMSVPVTGLVFCIVIFRVGLRQRGDSEHYTANSSHGGAGVPPTRISWAPGKVTGGTGLSGRHASVHVSTTRTSKADPTPQSRSFSVHGLSPYANQEARRSDLDDIEMEFKSPGDPKGVYAV